MIFCIHVYTDTSPEFYFRFRFRNSEGNEVGNKMVSLRFNFCVNGKVELFFYLHLTILAFLLTILVFLLTVGAFSLTVAKCVY